MLAVEKVMRIILRRLAYLVKFNKLYVYERIT
jgi:hypothetical protein